jgi:hypothetical protein
VITVEHRMRQELRRALERIGDSPRGTAIEGGDRRLDTECIPHALDDAAVGDLVERDAERVVIDEPEIDPVIPCS